MRYKSTQINKVKKKKTYKCNVVIIDVHNEVFGEIVDVHFPHVVQSVLHRRRHSDSIRVYTLQLQRKKYLYCTIDTV
jgi:hypothetical protein